jgi:hypothetical protein
VGAIRTVLARNAAIDADVFFACEPSNTIVRVIAARIDAKAATDALIALVGRVTAVVVIFACTAAYDETAREIIAAGRQTRLAHRTGVFHVAKRIRVWTRRTTKTRVAPRATTVGNAAVTAPVRRDAPIVAGVADGSVEIDTAVQIDGGIASQFVGNDGGNGFTTAGRCRNDQHEVSKEWHRLGGRLAGRRIVRA